MLGPRASSGREDALWASPPRSLWFAIVSGACATYRLPIVLAIDHIVVPVSDLDRAAAEVEARYGLASVEGGRHPAWGTANRIVPLGDAYVELVAVADPKTAHRATFG